jgi:hypothetical protein
MLYPTRTNALAGGGSLVVRHPNPLMTVLAYQVASGLAV